MRSCWRERCDEKENVEEQKREKEKGKETEIEKTTRITCCLEEQAMKNHQKCLQNHRRG